MLLLVPYFSYLSVRRQHRVSTRAHLLAMTLGSFPGSFSGSFPSSFSGSAVEQALLALVAAEDGDAGAARGHIARARRRARPPARRDRQIVEIAALVVAGDLPRAAGLALEHTAEFPDDAGLLARVADGYD